VCEWSSCWKPNARTEFKTLLELLLYLKQNVGLKSCFYRKTTLVSRKYLIF
jgi:hypothetical protein